jgi:hypothetical protein
MLILLDVILSCNLLRLINYRRKCRGDNRLVPKTGKQTGSRDQLTIAEISRHQSVDTAHDKKNRHHLMHELQIIKFVRVTTNCGVK